MPVPFHQRRRDLVGAATCRLRWHQHHGVPAARDLLDDLGLLAPEGVVSEDGGEDLEGGIRLLGIALTESGDRVGGAQGFHGAHSRRTADGA